MPKNRFAASFGIEPIEDIRLTVEYVLDDEYIDFGENAFADGDPTDGDADSVTIQAVYRF